VGFWQILFLLLRWGPSVYALVKEIIKLIELWREKRPVADAGFEFAYTQQLDMALAHYKKTGDRAPLEKLRDNLKNVVL
jgi:hypothetical protein